MILTGYYVRMVEFPQDLPAYVTLTPERRGPSDVSVQVHPEEGRRFLEKVGEPVAIEVETFGVGRFSYHRVRLVDA